MGFFIADYFFVLSIDNNMPETPFKHEVDVEVCNDLFLVASCDFDGSRFCGILLKASSGAADSTSALDDCSKLKSLARSQSVSSLNGVSRLDRDKLSSLCFRRTFFDDGVVQSVDDANPFRLLQNSRQARGIRRQECRPIRLRPIAVQRPTTTLCSKCQQCLKADSDSSLNSVSNNATSKASRRNKSSSTASGNKNNKKALRMKRLVSRLPKFSSPPTKNNKQSIEQRRRQFSVIFERLTSSNKLKSEECKVEADSTFVRDAFDALGAVKRIKMEPESESIDGDQKSINTDRKSINNQENSIQPISIEFSNRASSNQPISVELANRASASLPRIPKLKIRLSKNEVIPVIHSLGHERTIDDDESSLPLSSLANQSINETDQSESPAAIMNLENSVSQDWTPSNPESLPNFVKLNGIVWAKMRSYPYWPAKIFSLQQTTVCVIWCGSIQYGYVDVSILESFLDSFSKRYNAKRSLPYQKAVADALSHFSDDDVIKNQRFLNNLSPSCRKSLSDICRSKQFRAAKRKAGQKGRLILDHRAAGQSNISRISTNFTVQSSTSNPQALASGTNYRKFSDHQTNSGSNPSSDGNPVVSRPRAAVAISTCQPRLQTDNQTNNNHCSQSKDNIPLAVLVKRESEPDLVAAELLERIVPSAQQLAKKNTVVHLNLKQPSDVAKKPDQTAIVADYRLKNRIKMFRMKSSDDSYSFTRPETSTTSLTVKQYNSANAPQARQSVESGSAGLRKQTASDCKPPEAKKNSPAILREIDIFAPTTSRTHSSSVATTTTTSKIIDSKKIPQSAGGERPAKQAIESFLFGEKFIKNVRPLNFKKRLMYSMDNTDLSYSIPRVHRNSPDPKLPVQPSPSTNVKTASFPFYTPDRSLVGGKMAKIDISTPPTSGIPLKKSILKKSSAFIDQQRPLSHSANQNARSPCFSYNPPISIKPRPPFDAVSHVDQSATSDKIESQSMKIAPMDADLQSPCSPSNSATSSCDSPRLVIDEEEAMTSSAKPQDNIVTSHANNCNATIIGQNSNNGDSGSKLTLTCKPGSNQIVEPPLNSTPSTTTTNLGKDEFDDVLSELRRMNEMCENSSSSCCSSISR